MSTSSTRESGSYDPRQEVQRRGHYSSRYMGPDFIRLTSFREQLNYALKSKPKELLLVGKGDGFVAGMLADRGVKVTVLDVNADLEPDVVASVDSIPLEDGAFDVSVCCQVLEHLPFDRFGASLRELRRVTRDRLVLSLPDVRRIVSLRFKAPKIQIDWQISVARFRAPVLPAGYTEKHGHHWEVGYRGSTFGQVRGAIEDSGWKVLKVRRVSDMPGHTFFYCEAE